MNKKNIIIIIVVLLIALILFIFIDKINNKKENKNISINTNKNVNTSSNTKPNNNSKVLVVYYSGQNHTKKIAEEISSKLNADIFEIEPSEKYTEDDLDWNNEKSRVNIEHENESKRNIKLKKNTPDNWDSYDTIILGYPIWWGIAAWPTDSFVKNNNFDGKTVIPFCTSFSSGIGSSASNLEEEANGGKWTEGHRFYEDEPLKTVDKWINSLNL